MATTSIDIMPKEFCRALWERKRVLAGPNTVTGIKMVQLGILLKHFWTIEPDISPDDFGKRLEELASDDRPRRALLRLMAQETLKIWRARQWHRLDDGTLVVLDPPKRRRSSN